MFRPSLSRHSPHTTDGSSLKGAGLSLGGFTKNDLLSLLCRLFLCAVCVTLEPDLLRELCKCGNSANAAAKYPQFPILLAGSECYTVEDTPDYYNLAYFNGILQLQSITVLKLD